MVVNTALAFLVAASPFVLQQEERPKAPERLPSRHGHGLPERARPQGRRRPPGGHHERPDVRGHSFRVAGKKDIMKIVKEDDGQRVEVTGLIRKSALMEPGVKFKGGRVVVGGGTMASGTSSLPDPSENVLVLDAWSVQALGGSCSS